jgi:predicted Ser/Thr protein kinase
MPLSIGEKLGPYEVVATIGAGGMGEVYRARDTRLGRDVAIKVSAERFSERFEHEAQLIASLNHQNICSLFDVGPNFLVMELIEGPTLAERISDGAIPLEESLRIALQIADALGAAHESGIVHRDLKPGNIKIKPDGTVKVLDFGLAKTGGTRAASAEHSPTISMAATQAGMIVGTAAYMSPEQARGKPVDKRADIWAFGAVLYEMLTGRQLFRGEDISETLASVIMKEPDLEPVPPRVRRVLRRCLEKDPAKRLRDISGVALLLEQEPPPAAITGRRSGRSWLWPAVAGCAAVIAAIMGAGWYLARPAEAALKPLVRLNVDLGPNVALSSSALSGANVMLSPDGHRLAYISQGRLFTWSLDQPTAIELSGTDGAYGAFFSPDGQWLAFFAGGLLKKVSVVGGAAVNLCDAPAGRGGAWGEDGNIIASLSGSGFLSRIPASGGTPTPVTELAQGEAVHRWPQVLQGANAVMFTANSSTTGFDDASIKVRSLTDGSTKVVLQGGTYGRVVGTRKGHTYLTYVNRNTLFAARFDLDRMGMAGSPVPVLEGVGALPTGTVEMDVSAEGTLVYRGLAGGAGLLTLQWMDAAGALQPLITKPGLYGRPSVSPDGKRVAVEFAQSSGFDIWVYDPQRDNMSRLTFGGGANLAPIWSPDGRYIVYQDHGGMSWVRSDGSAPQPLLRSKNLEFPWSFTSDGSRLGYLELGKGGYDLWTVSLEGDAVSGIRAGKPAVFLNSDFDERYPSFSPDGKWLAYASNESGTFEVYVRPFPNTGGKWQVSSAGGAYPMWSRSERKLFFETLDAHIMSVSYSFTNDSFVADKPRPWSPKALVNLVNSSKNLDLAPDGKRVAALMPVETAEDLGAQNHVTFLLNFLDELERRVPGGK